MEQWYVWLALIIILAFIEFTTINLTTMWSIASAIVAMILSFFTDNYIIQFAVFVILGVVLLITTRPILLKAFNKKKEKTNVDRVIGMEAIVTEKITKHKSGEVKVDGKLWTAEADEDIDVDEIVKVLDIDGVYLKVQKEGEK